MPQCLEPGCVRIVKGTRCDQHSGRPHYRNGWTRFAREWLDAWTAARGPLCVGWQREPHMVTRADLTLDHVEARTAAAGYQSLCRSCNSSKGARNAVEGTELRR